MNVQVNPPDSFWKTIIVVIVIGVFGLLAAIAPVILQQSPENEQQVIPTSTPLATPPTPINNTTILPSSAIEFPLNELPDSLEQKVSTSTVLYSDAFDGETLSSNWISNRSPNLRLDSGIAVISGNERFVGIQRPRIDAGEGILLLFKYDDADDMGQVAFYLDNTNWLTPGYRSWNFAYYESNGKGFWSNHICVESDCVDREAKSVIYLRPQVWHYLLITISKTGEFSTSVWEQGRSDHLLVDDKRIPDWSIPENSTWRFIIELSKPTLQLYLDSYYEFRFE